MRDGTPPKDMFGIEPLLGVLTAAVLGLVVVAALLLAALIGRGPLYRRFLRIDRSLRRPPANRADAQGYRRGSVAGFGQRPDWPTASGLRPGRAPDAGAGHGPGVAAGYGQEADSGYGHDGGPVFGPGSRFGPGYVPGYERGALGTDPGYAQGYPPGFGHGTDPGYGQDTDPGYAQGYSFGPGHSSAAGRNYSLGYGRGFEPGGRLNTEPGFRPGAEGGQPGQTAGRAEAEDRRARADGDGLDEVLRGSFAMETYNRAVRILAWSAIAMALLIVVVSQLWRPVEPQILTTLVAAGLFVLVVQELMPPDRLRAVRVVVEGTATIVFLTVIVMLTGNSASPFFYLYPILIGGAALIAAPRITLIFALECVVAYAAAAFPAPLDLNTDRDTLARVGVNATALVLLAYAGTIIARVQSRTRDVAIRLSTIDYLTDLYNRAFFFNALDGEIRRGERFGRGFCLLMMDLDGLKMVNDLYGHYHGDAVLRGVARVIRAGLRGIDVAARYGGDEFVALLPETDPSGAFVVAEKIRQMVLDLSVDAAGETITTSLSIGVVSYPDDGLTADTLMIAADAAMYTSKRLGKNRVVGYARPTDLPSAAPYAGRQQPPTPGFTPLPKRGDSEPDADLRR